MNRPTPTLPQQEGELFLTDGGIETDLVFHDGAELPEFAAFDLLKDDAGRETLRRYYDRYLAIARDHGVGFVLETPTWRASVDWGERLGYDRDRLARANRAAVTLLAELRRKYEGHGFPIVTSGCIGPRGDGYEPGTLMTSDQARHYHAFQVEVFSACGTDLVTAITMTNVPEATGIAMAARDAELPVVLSFTLETDGRLPTGETLARAIGAVDRATDGYPSYYMLNCAHPSHLEPALGDPALDPWRIQGLRANASRMSHAELEAAETLDEGDPDALAQDYRRLRERLPALQVLGGCCGTDQRHVRAIARACAPV